MICAQHSQTDQANETPFTPKCRHTHTLRVCVHQLFVPVSSDCGVEYSVGHKIPITVDLQRYNYIYQMRYKHV